MTRDEAISQGTTSIQQSLNQAIGVAFDAGSASVDQSGNGKQFAQSDIDAAVAKVTSDDQSHIQDLQSQISADSSTMSALKASMKDALSAALSILSPGSDSTATQQTPGVASSTTVAPAAQVQTAGPAASSNDGTETPTAVSATGAAPAASAVATSATVPAASTAPAASATPTPAGASSST